MTEEGNGTFEVDLAPAPAELDGAVDRFEFEKTFSGDIEGTGRGVMLSCGDPKKGAAGYVAIEVVSGSLGGRQGSFALQQLGMISNGTQTLDYEIVPGSGQGELEGLVGSLELAIEADGTHRYKLTYEAT